MKFLSFLILFAAFSAILCHPGHISGVKGGRSEHRSGHSDNQGGNVNNQEEFEGNQDIYSGNPGHQHGIKSYGGYFHDHNNFRHTHAYHQQQQPNYYQPYGWNYNQPTRTYGDLTFIRGDFGELIIYAFDRRRNSTEQPGKPPRFRLVRTRRWMGQSIWQSIRQSR